MNVSLVLPCLNEGFSPLGLHSKIHNIFKMSEYPYDVVLSDKGSTYKSIGIRKSYGFVVDRTNKKGYGREFQKGFYSAKGERIVKGDTECIYVD